MNWLSWLVPKNELITEDSVRALIRSTGLKSSLSRTFIRSLMVRAILGVKLLSYGTNPTVRQVVNIIDNCLGIDQTDQVLHDENDVLIGQYTGLPVMIQTEFLVDPVTANFTQVIALIREEQLLDNV